MTQLLSLTPAAAYLVMVAYHNEQLPWDLDSMLVVDSLRRAAPANNPRPAPVTPQKITIIPDAFANRLVMPTNK